MKEVSKMEFPLNEEHRMVVDVVRRFVKEDLMPLEKSVLEREATGQGLSFSKEDEKMLENKSQSLGLWGLDVPEEYGGSDLPADAMVAIHFELAKTISPYKTLPDSPNLAMLMMTATEQQKKDYLLPYAEGKKKSFIAISEPGAGGDPASMQTTAVRDGDDYVINGRKIWISRVAEADFGIVMAATNRQAGSKGGISAFLVDKGTKGFIHVRRIPMIGGAYTNELLFEDCRIPATKILGQEGQGYGPMQQRLSVRRLQIGAWCLGFAHRAMNMMVDHVTQRKTFGVLLADRQAIQWWIADGTTQMHALRLMLIDAADRVKKGERLRSELSMIKVFATEMAAEIVDHAMQSFGGMGMTKELPLQAMANRIRVWRVLEGPSEVHRQLVARNRIRAGNIA
jgi:acyl-CoA dehydrogenase